jgi:seryl-tRNA synthetase
MKYQLICQFVLRDKLPQDAENQIKKWLEEIRKMLEKGIKEESLPKISKIKKWEIVSREKEDALQFTITSGEVIPPHHAILRMRKFLAQKIGRKYHIGLGEVVFKSYKIDVDIPNKPEEKFSIPFVNKITFQENKAKLEIDNQIPIDLVEKGAIDRIVKLVPNKIIEEKTRGKDEHHRVIWSSKKKKIITKENPTEKMLEDGWIERTNYRNQWIFAPAGAALTEALKQIMVDQLYIPLGFKNILIPKVVPWDVWKRSGHLSGIFQGGFEPYFVCTPQTADPGYWEEIADYYRITLDVKPEKIMEKLRPPVGGLSFAQCPPFWPYLQGKTISDDSFPILVYDWSGPTYRYESDSAHGFERVDELHRIETLYIGFKDQIEDIAQKVRVKFREIFDKTLELEFREAWVTPWWSSQEGYQEETKPSILSQDSFDQQGTLDIETYLPYLGSREESKWLETQNVSNNGTKYPKAFTVKAQSGKELWSGCAGGSFERFISAFVAQKGTNPDKWPKKVREYISELPSGPTFL